MEKVQRLDGSWGVIPLRYSPPTSKEVPKMKINRIWSFG